MIVAWRAFNVGFVIAIVLTVVLFVFRSWRDDEQRLNFGSHIVIIHADQSLVLKDQSGQFETFHWAERIDLNAGQFSCGAYIFVWTVARLACIIPKIGTSPLESDVSKIRDQSESQDHIKQSTI